MTNEQMRELDAWIAEHVMGWKLFRDGRNNIAAEMPTGETCIVTANHPWDESDFSPTVDSAPAMEVLKKCVDVLYGCNSFSLEVFRNGNHWVVRHPIYGSPHAPTLELAICLFAKQLFSPK